MHELDVGNVCFYNQVRMGPLDADIYLYVQMNDIWLSIYNTLSSSTETTVKPKAKKRKQKTSIYRDASQY